MKSVNKVILLGNATRDPQLKVTQSDQSIVTFGLATNRTWKDASGAKQSLAEFHSLVAWGKLAEFIAQNVAKGKPLFIEGYLKTRSWDSPEGAKIFRTEVVVDNIVLVGPRPEGPHEEATEFSMEPTIDPLDIEHLEPIAA